MPRIEHEPWCERHYEGEGICATEMDEFGPMVPGWPDGEPVSTGGISCEREGRDPVRVFIEYRTQGGLMDVESLRAVREAVADDPALFLAVLDGLIDKTGEAVPAARRVGMPEPASS